MKLTKSVNFALRIVICLAREKEALTMPVLSERLNISYNHLSKLVQILRKASLLRTIQGKHGGVHFHLPPDSVTVRQIVDVIDGPTYLAECLEHDHDNVCQFLGDCKLQLALAKVQKRINDEMDAIYIGDLI